jgi:outer membrane receptor for ferrienterochelin and colicin
LTSQFKESDWDEYLGRAYLYWAPHKWLALKAEYRYERFERAKEISANMKEVKTHSIPLGINFFHPFGLTAKLQAVYYHQKGNFQRADGTRGTFVQGKDNFWVVDAAISYRLPKRYGFITIGARNLFDKSFEYAETDENNPRIQPDRFIFCKLTIAFN